ncbi:hypothetical protein ACFY2H_00630 [Streptomyces griseofuscus]|uniref:hypothetical protein n=1 Tax=Streptomyces griseofuscus TaxID=146922 RepID=UPI0036AD221B
MSERHVWEVVVPDEDGREYVYQVDTHPLMRERTVALQMWVWHCRDGGDANPTKVRARLLEVEAA